MKSHAQILAGIALQKYRKNTQQKFILSFIHVYILKTAVLNIASDTREERKKHKKKQGAHERTEVNTLKKALIEICKGGGRVRGGMKEC